MAEQLQCLIDLGTARRAGPRCERVDVSEVVHAQLDGWSVFAPARVAVSRESVLVSRDRIGAMCRSARDLETGRLRVAGENEPVWICRSGGVGVIASLLRLLDRLRRYLLGFLSIAIRRKHAAARLKTGRDHLQGFRVRPGVRCVQGQARQVLRFV
jgi:hypothetical protein